MYNQIAPILVELTAPGDTADSDGYCRSRKNGETYVIKSARMHPLLPASEVFCAALAEACQLPYAGGAWITLPDGRDAFGSRWEGGAMKPFANSPVPVIGNRLTRAAIKRQWQRITSPDVASGIYAFDLFLFNYDRHFNNLLHQDQNGVRVVRVIDHSRAWWTVAHDLFTLPAPTQMHGWPGERTISAFRDIVQWTQFSAQQAMDTLDLIERTPLQWVNNVCVSGIPPGWLPDPVKDNLLQWWSSTDRNQRIDAIRQGLNNGQLL
jgi:hypothetical protein